MSEVKLPKLLCPVVLDQRGRLRAFKFEDGHVRIGQDPRSKCIPDCYKCMEERGE